MQTISNRRIFPKVLVTLAMLIAMTSGTLAFAASCLSGSSKCGLPLVFLGAHNDLQSTSDLFSVVQRANPSLYASPVVYYTFFDSRTGKVSFQDEHGVNVKPASDARQFVVLWHDGSSTDWRFIDPVLAARVPKTAKADQLAHITWAIKVATATPSVLLVGANEDLAFAKYYVAGKATPQFGGASHAYNNDVHGLLPTDQHASAENAALNALGIAKLLADSATQEYQKKDLLVRDAAVTFVDGIVATAMPDGNGKSLQLTSNFGPVIWSILEGPSAGAIDEKGIFTASSKGGAAHIVGISQTDRTTFSVLAVSTAASAAPVVTTYNESAVTSVSAQFNGAVNPNGASGVAGFQYSLNSSFSPAYGTSTTAVSGSTTVPFSVTQTNLTTGTTYYVRAFFRDGTTNVTTFGVVSSFKTIGNWVTTTNASLVTSSDATLNMSYNSGGASGSVYFSYSPDAFVHTYYTTHITIAGDSQTHTAQARLSALSTGTTYQYKAYLNLNSGGGTVLTGTAVAFKTLGIFAENVKPGWATSITANGATFPGKYGTGGGPAEVWLDVSTDPAFSNPPASVYGAFTVPSGVYTYASVSTTITTLKTGTTYYIRYAIKNTENGYTYRYPYTRSFTTLGPQSVSLAAAYNRMGIVSNGTKFTQSLTTAYNGGCCSLVSGLLGTSGTFNGITYTYGTANTNNVVYGAGQTISLSAGNWTSLNFLGSGVNGNQSGSFVVHYTDGTSTTFTQSMSDWAAPQSYAGETKVLTMQYAGQYDGKHNQSHSWYLYAYSFALNSAKTIQSITLPTNSNINIVAITLNH